MSQFTKCCRAKSFARKKSSIIDGMAKCEFPQSSAILLRQVKLRERAQSQWIRLGGRACSRTLIDGGTTLCYYQSGTRTLPPDAGRQPKRRRTNRVADRLVVYKYFSIFGKSQTRSNFYYIQWNSGKNDHDIWKVQVMGLNRKRC